MRPKRRLPPESSANSMPRTRRLERPSCKGIRSTPDSVAIARHGFQSVTTQLAFGYPHFLEVCQRHGIEISATRVRKVMKHFEAEQGKTRAWRKILEQTTGALLRQLGEDPRVAADDDEERA